MPPHTQVHFTLQRSMLTSGEFNTDIHQAWNCKGKPQTQPHSHALCHTGNSLVGNSVHTNKCAIAALLQNNVPLAPQETEWPTAAEKQMKCLPQGHNKCEYVLQNLRNYFGGVFRDTVHLKSPYVPRLWVSETLLPYFHRMFLWFHTLESSVRVFANFNLPVWVFFYIFFE